MDLDAVTTAAAALIAQSMAGKAGELAATEAWGRLKSAVEAIRIKLRQEENAEAAKALDHLEERPAEPERQHAVAAVLKRKARSDPDFAGQLTEFVQNVSDDRLFADFITNILPGAEVGQVVNIRTARDLHFGR